MDDVQDDAQAVICACRWRRRWTLTSREEERQRAGAVGEGPESEGEDEEGEQSSRPAGGTRDEEGHWHYQMGYRHGRPIRGLCSRKETRA